MFVFKQKLFYFIRNNIDAKIVTTSVFFINSTIFDQYFSPDEGINYELFIY